MIFSWKKVMTQVLDVKVAIFLNPSGLNAYLKIYKELKALPVMLP
jgi:hypothetical protein